MFIVCCSFLLNEMNEKKCQHIYPIGVLWLSTKKLKKICKWLRQNVRTFSNNKKSQVIPVMHLLCLIFDLCRFFSSMSNATEKSSFLHINSVAFSIFHLARFPQECGHHRKKIKLAKISFRPNLNGKHCDIFLSSNLHPVSICRRSYVFYFVFVSRNNLSPILCTGIAVTLNSQTTKKLN